jgi:hypothetical protein
MPRTIDKWKKSCTWCGGIGLDMITMKPNGNYVRIYMLPAYIYIYIYIYMLFDCSSSWFAENVRGFSIIFNSLINGSVSFGLNFFHFYFILLFIGSYILTKILIHNPTIDILTPTPLFTGHLTFLLNHKNKIKTKIKKRLLINLSPS